MYAECSIDMEYIKAVALVGACLHPGWHTIHTTLSCMCSSVSAPYTCILICAERSLTSQSSICTLCWQADGTLLAPEPIAELLRVPREAQTHVLSCNIAITIYCLLSPSHHLVALRLSILHTSHRTWSSIFYPIFYLLSYILYPISYILYPTSFLCLFHLSLRSRLSSVMYWLSLCYFQSS